MKLNEKFVKLYEAAADNVRQTPKYKEFYNLICGRLEYYANNACLNEVKVPNVPEKIRDVLCNDLRNEGLAVTKVNDHALYVSVELIRVRRQTGA